MSDAKKKPAGWSREIPHDAIKALIEMGEGHSLLRPAALVEAGFPADIIASFTGTHLPDYFPDGTKGKEVRAVYDLHLLCALADDLGVEYFHADGRGRRFRQASAALTEYLDAESAG